MPVDPDFKPFICLNAQGLKALPHWLVKVGPFNDWIEKEDRNRRPIIKLGLATRPGSYRGEWRQVEVIICAEALCDAAGDLIDAELNRRENQPAAAPTRPAPAAEPAGSGDQPDVKSWF